MQTLKTMLAMLGLMLGLAFAVVAADRKPTRADRQSLALCQSMLKDYRALLSKGKAVEAKPLNLMQDMMATLQRAQPQHLVVAKELAELKSFTQPQLPTAAAYVAERFTPDAALAQALGPADADAMGDASWITRMPGANLYGVSLMAGTMRCETFNPLFALSGKTARLVVDPGYEEGGCGAGRFASWRGQPILITGADTGPTTAEGYFLREGYTIRPWRKDRFGKACVMVLRYAADLRFTDAGDKPDCASAQTDCQRLRQAALALLTRYKRNPGGILKELYAEIGEAGEKAFLVQKQAFDAEAATRTEVEGQWRLDQSPTLDVEDRDSIPLTVKPLALPLKDGDDTLLVVFGHQLTTGSRDIPFYDVSVRQMREGTSVEKAGFVFALRFGRLLRSEVKLE